MMDTYSDNGVMLLVALDASPNGGCIVRKLQNVCRKGHPSSLNAEQTSTGHHLNCNWHMWGCLNFGNLLLACQSVNICASLLLTTKRASKRKAKEARYKWIGIQITPLQTNPSKDTLQKNVPKFRGSMLIQSLA